MVKMVRENLTLFLFGLIGAVVTSLAFGGWAARDFVATLATKDEVMVLAAKSDFILDRQIEALVGQIAYLERKPNKTAAELQQLDYLRKQLERLRRVRDGR